MPDHYVLGVPPKIGKLMWWVTAPFVLCPTHWQELDEDKQNRYHGCDCHELTEICEACAHRS